MEDKKEKLPGTNINCEKPIYRNFHSNHWKCWFFDVEIFTYFYRIERRRWKFRPKDLIIRSSSAEFLIFERQTHDKGIQVRFEEGDLWLTQKAMSELYDCSTDNISLHLKNIYNDLELDKGSTTEDFSIVQKEGNRKVKRNIKYYNLDAVISVGYRVNSDRAVQFRRWATNILKEFSKKGYIIDKKRMERRKWRL